MANDPATFLRVILDWVEKAKLAPMEVVRETIQDINNEIIATTPVDTGFLRNSYYAGINQVPSGAGGAGTTAVNAVAAQLQPGDTYVLGNVAVYARRVEYGFVGEDALGRSYNQAGRFWIARVIDRAPAIAEAAAARVAARNNA